VFGGQRADVADAQRMAQTVGRADDDHVVADLYLTRIGHRANR
jgi:hypothetical protein